MTNAQYFKVYKIYGHLICLAWIKRDEFNFIFINILNFELFIKLYAYISVCLFFYVCIVLFNKIILNNKKLNTLPSSICRFSQICLHLLSQVYASAACYSEADTQPWIWYDVMICCEMHFLYCTLHPSNDSFARSSSTPAQFPA